MFSGLCVHSDSIRHQRNISRHSWIDRGEEEDPECHQYENIQLLGFCMWMDSKKEDIRNYCFVSLCVFDMRSRYYNEIQTSNTLLPSGFVFMHITQTCVFDTDG